MPLGNSICRAAPDCQGALLRTTDILFSHRTGNYDRSPSGIIDQIDISILHLILTLCSWYNSVLGHVVCVVVHSIGPRTHMFYQIEIDDRITGRISSVALTCLFKSVEHLQWLIINSVLWIPRIVHRLAIHLFHRCQFEINSGEIRLHSIASSLINLEF